MKCEKCDSELDFSNPEMVLVSNEYNHVSVVTCECGESYQVRYDITDVTIEEGYSIL
jgi:RNase P subunit RPR2